MPEAEQIDYTLAKYHNIFILIRGIDVAMWGWNQLKGDDIYC